MAGVTALGMAGVGVYAVAFTRRAMRRSQDGEVSQEVSEAVEAALDELGASATPDEVADLAYPVLYPDCPRRLDPELEAHASCVDLWMRVRDEARDQLGCSHLAPPREVYPPGSTGQIALFERAAAMVGVPEAWARSQDLWFILANESGGVVGRPNYTYGWRADDEACWGGIHDDLRAGKITARSSATGLGQLLLRNVDTYYPSGREGIGDAVQEAAGMLAYIEARYGSPSAARECYGKGSKQSPCLVPGKRPKTFQEGY